ncbi:MAG: MaoC family dehydratase [Stellaceae bacterium]
MPSAPLARPSRTSGPEAIRRRVPADYRGSVATSARSSRRSSVARFSPNAAPRRAWAAAQGLTPARTRSASAGQVLPADRRRRLARTALERRFEAGLLRLERGARRVRPHQCGGGCLGHLARKEQVMTVRYLEDFAAGQRFGSGRLTMDAARIKSFAAEFDPQPFHRDEGAAAKSIFRGLAASGWHTAAVTMRLLVEGEIEPAGGIVGAGFEELAWPRPVRPGDELHLESEILEVRPSRTRPEIGLVKMRTTTFNQNGEPVQILVGTILVPRRRREGGPGNLSRE